MIDLHDCDARRLPNERHASVCAFANLELRSPDAAAASGLPASAFLLSFTPKSRGRCVIKAELKVKAFWRLPRVIPSGGGVIPAWHDADLEPWREGATRPPVVMTPSAAARRKKRRESLRRGWGAAGADEDEERKETRTTIVTAAPQVGRARQMMHPAEAGVVAPLAPPAAATTAAHDMEVVV